MARHYRDLTKAETRSMAREFNHGRGYICEHNLRCVKCSLVRLTPGGVKRNRRARAERARRIERLSRED